VTSPPARGVAPPGVGTHSTRTLTFLLLSSNAADVSGHAARRHRFLGVESSWPSDRRGVRELSGHGIACRSPRQGDAGRRRVCGHDCCLDLHAAQHRGCARCHGPPRGRLPVLCGGSKLGGRRCPARLGRVGVPAAGTASRLRDPDHRGGSQECRWGARVEVGSAGPSPQGLRTTMGSGGTSGSLHRVGYRTGG
jgi:hypothetical protein